MEEQVQRGQEWLEQLLNFMGVPATVTIEESENIPTDSDSCWLTIEESNLTPEQIELLIGKQGESIDAIQYLANTLLNLTLESELQGSYTIELNKYRITRHQELLELAQQVAQKVRETRQEIEIPALSSAERRQIHNFLKDATDLETESRGQEPDRRLVVKLR
jgi:spoIIIJ-associated protein